MTVRYVDGGLGNDSWDGLSPVFVSGTNGPKKTLNGMEATPPLAGDLVHAKAGVYREELLCTGGSGSIGNPIEYRGDYLGLIWPGSGGVVRITGSDDDKAMTRVSVLGIGGASYRTFTNFLMDMTSGAVCFIQGANNILQKCALILSAKTGQSGISISTVNQLNNLIDRCFIYGNQPGGQAVFVTHTATLNNIGHIIQNCVIEGTQRGVQIDRVGGVLVKNCIIKDTAETGVRITTALAAGQFETVNNCIISNCVTGLRGISLGDIVEDYNAFSGNTTDRSTVNTGAHSNTYPPIFDTRWFFDIVNRGAGPESPLQISSRFDLSSYSQLIDLAGTSPAATDMRGTGTIGAQREWGPLEYDVTLKTIGGIHKSRMIGSGV